MTADGNGCFYLLDVNESFFNSAGGLASCSVLAIVFLVMCFFFALCRDAVEAASASALKGSVDNKTAALKRALKIKEHSDKYIRRTQAGVTINAAALTGCCFLTFTEPLYDLMYDLVHNSAAAVCLALLVILVLLTVIIAAFGYYIPGRCVVRQAEKTLVSLSGIIACSSVLFVPVSAAANAVTYLVIKISGAEKSGSKKTENPTEEKILMMVDEGEENGTIEENTKSMIENVFDFDDTTVGEIMTHRKDIVAVRDDDDIKTLTSSAIDSGRSRIPVYHEDIDDIVGIIYVKDLLRYVGVDSSIKAIDKEMIHEAVYVPQSKRCSEMFEYMTANKTQIAVVVDEFGGTGGIITMEDLIESIVGSIQDEYDNEDEDIKRVNEYSFRVDGATSLDEIEHLTGISFGEDANDTIAGIMLDRMGHIPKSGEHPSIMINGTRFTVLEVDGRRISEVLIVKNHKTPV